MAVASSFRINKRIIAIITDPHSSPQKVRNAFAYLYLEDEGRVKNDFVEGVRALYENHPRIAEEFSAMIPERLTRKGCEWAV